MKTNEKVLGYKKIGQNSALMTMYFCYEGVCDFFVKVISPNNDSYPNFIIKIAMPEISGAAAVENEQRAAGNEPEQALTQFYQGVSDKIFAGTYSEEVASRIKTAQLIADSLAEVEATANWKTYSNNNDPHRFSFRYPSEYSMKIGKQGELFALNFSATDGSVPIGLSVLPTEDVARQISGFEGDGATTAGVRINSNTWTKLERNSGIGPIVTYIVSGTNYAYQFDASGDGITKIESIVNSFSFGSN
jgi:hypothetical protein